MKNFKYLILVILSIIVAMPILARESPEDETDYEPLIREDRIWEYYHVPGSRGVYIVFRVKFNGTKVVKGNTYHLLERIYNRRIEERVVNDPLTGHRVEVHEQISEDPSEFPIYLMREENGRVYGIYEPDNSPFFWAAEDFDGKIDFCDEEFILYDFKIKENELYPSVRHSYQAVAPTKCAVVSSKTIENCNRDFKVRRIRIFLQNYGVFEPGGEDIVEGIGPIGSGLAWLFPMFPDDELRVYLNNVYDLEGNIVFEGDHRYMDLINGLTEINEVKCNKQSELLLHDETIICSGFNFDNLNVYDVSGRTVLSQQVEGGDRVDVSELPSGIYIATLSTGAKLKIRK